MKRAQLPPILCAVVLSTSAVWLLEPLVSSGQAPRVNPLVQVHGGNGTPGEEEDVGLSSDVMFPSNRELVRKLRQTRELVDERRFSDAVAVLDRILAESEDSFFEPNSDVQVFRSLKSEALRLIGRLPPEGLASYRLQFGERARKLLAEAIERGDPSTLELVARRYFHTDAGYEATLLLGRRHLDSGHVLQAAAAFQQLIDTPEALAKFDPSLSLLSATCWVRAGMNERAKETLIALKRRMGGAPIEIAGRKASLFQRDRDAVAWLRQVIGEQQRPMVDSVEGQWLTFRGNSLRNAQSEGGVPLLIPQWRVRTIDHPAYEQGIRRIQEDYSERGVAIMPSVHPLAVNGVVLLRTMQNLLAVEMRTGRRLWEVRPPEDDPFQEYLSDPDNRRNQRNANQYAEALRQRLWGDAIYGMLSSDGERVFAIRGLETAAPGLAARAFALGVSRNEITEMAFSNRLSAFELKSEGKLVWEIGGAESDDPLLREAFFLGPPLVLSGELYVLAEMKSSVRLLVLEASTGKLQWSQRLADLERTVQQDPIRRLAGATPSYSDGVLVCPTSAGAVVGVDLAKRSLRWAYQYPQQFQPNTRAAILWAQNRRLERDENQRWMDNSATIAGGCVLLTPAESDDLHCLDLFDGSLCWKQPRGDSLYLGCVLDNRVILVGTGDLTAFNLDGGKIVWEEGDCPLPEGSTPSGRGFVSGLRYYLPLSSGEVAVYDLSDGQLVARSKPLRGGAPGNLICYQDNVISFSASSLDAYYQIEPLRARVKEALAKNSSNTEALALQGELALDDGRLGKAIDCFRLAYQQERAEWARDLLVQSLFTALKEDFATYRDAVGELEELVVDPHQRITLARLVAGGLHQVGEYQEAVDAYLRLAEMSQWEDRLEPIDSKWSTRMDPWIQSQLISLRDSANASLREVIDRGIAEQRSHLDESNPDEIVRFLDLFGDVGNHDDLRLRLAQHDLEAGNYLEAESALIDLEDSTDRRSRNAATALIAELLRRSQRASHAAIYYRRLRDELADEVCWEGKTGRELVEALDQDDPVRLALSTKPRWSFGEVQVKTTGRGANTANQSRRSEIPVEFVGPVNSFFQEMRLAHDLQERTVGGFDPYGAEELRFSLDSGINTSRSRYMVRGRSEQARVRGHQLFVASGTDVFAVDTLQRTSLRADQLMWSRDLDEQFHAQDDMTRILLDNAFSNSRRSAAQGVLGPVTRYGVIIRRQRELVCVDSLTGEEIWIRGGIPADAELFGSAERLYVLAPDSNEATVIRPSDGKKIGEKTVPEESERVATYGHHVLQLRTVKGNRVEFRLVDPWDGAVVWSKQYEPYSKWRPVDHDTLAILERSGKFNILSIETGREIISADVGKQNSMTEIHVVSTPEQYFCFVSQPVAQKSRNRTVYRLTRHYPDSLLSREPFTGQIWAFHRASGKPQWPGPVEVTEKAYLPGQPASLPFLVFGQQIRERISGKNEIHGSVLCLDKRTGAVVLAKDKLRSSSVFELDGDPDTNEVNLSTPMFNFQFKITDGPTAPEPPFQEATERPSSIFNIFSR